MPLCDFPVVVSIERKMRRVYLGWSDDDVAEEPGVDGSLRSRCVHGMTSSCLESL